jgi:hypothetical protein
LKSCVPDVSPVVATCTPGSAPTVAGITSLRSVCSAVTDAALSPLPCSEIETISTVFSGLISVWIGCFI